MRVFLAVFFGLLFYQLSAQHGSDTQLLFNKIDSQIVANPTKARDLLVFVKKNYQNKEVLNNCNRLLVQSYYYENNFDDALQLISQTADQQNVDGVILYRNILYSIGVKNVDFIEKYNQDSLFNLNEKILKTNELLLGENKEKVFQQLIKIVPQITSNNKDNFRESLCFVLSNLSVNNWMSKYPEFRNPVLKILAFYNNDAEFDILKNDLLFANVSDEWLTKTKNLINTTPNFKLLTAYYNFLHHYYLYKKDISNYISNSNTRDQQINVNNREVAQARSQWIYLTEAKYNDDYIFARKRGSIILGAIILFFSVVIITFIIKIRQEKLKGNNYELLSNKLKTALSKKKESQVISESVKLNLLEKLEKLELTHFYLDPNISIQTLSKKLNSNSKYVSDIINTYKKKNFAAYINEMRIEYIKEKLNNDMVYRSYKIKYLAEESGFSSHSVFSSVFKSIEGVSPAQYIQNLK